jgi:cobalt transporter subunit CbtB
MSTLIRSVALPDARRDAIRYGLAAILLGILFIGVTGFAPLQALHDAAHNTRHAISFPCH